MLEDVIQKYIFITSIDRDTINEKNIKAIMDEVQVLETTKDANYLRQIILNVCPKHLGGCDKSSYFKKTCWFLTHVSITIEMYRDIAVTKLVNLLEGKETYGNFNPGYLAIQNRRRIKTKNWFTNLLVRDKKVACILFGQNPTTIWTSKTQQQEILMFGSYLDVQLKIPDEKYCKRISNLCSSKTLYNLRIFAMPTY